MLLLIAIWALAEATIFFIVVDVPIMALGIRAGVRKAMIGAGVAAVFAALGGAVLWQWASTSPDDAAQVMLAVPGIDAAMVGRVHAEWETGGALAMKIGSFSGVPYKLYALAAGAGTGSCGDGGFGALAWFVLASIFARLPRFVLVAAIAGWAGPRLRERFGTREVWAGFGLGWAAFYALYWSMTGF